MKQLSQLILCITLTVFGLSNAFGGNLSLIEKRLLELDSLNKQAVQKSGELPQNGSVEIKAKVLPTGSKKPSSSGVIERSFDFGKKTILAIDNELPYTVQISSSRSKKQCYKVANMLRRAGFPAFTASLDLKDQGVWHRIFIGSYSTHEEAELIKDKLEKDEISDGYIRSLPYAIQIGRAGNYDQLKSLRNEIFGMEYLPYTSTVRDTKSEKPQLRLLIGAYKEKTDTSRLLAELRKSGMEARVVTR